MALQPKGVPKGVVLALATRHTCSHVAFQPTGVVLAMLATSHICSHMYGFSAKGGGVSCASHKRFICSQKLAFQPKGGGVS
eukprot:2020762-Amphidinium_carterae.1